jgi:putative PIN family toxin of toxin-antitoxin system
VRIVLDSNVVFSALLWRGTPYRLLEAIRQQPSVQLCSSSTLLEELAEILARPAASKRLASIGKSVHNVLADYLDVIERVEPTAVPRAIFADPDDDHVLAAALAGRADLIVSGDRHLLDLGQFQDIRILRAAQAVAEIEAMR